MTDAPFFSVIIPVYNVAAYLRKCLESVAGAAGRMRTVCADAGVEVICVDDGSTDGSGNLLDEFAADVSVEQGLFFKVFHQRNGGVSSARNKALDEATGEWLVFVDSDDVVSPEVFVFLHRALAGSSVDLLRFGWVKVESQDIALERMGALCPPSGPVPTFDLEDPSTIRAAVRESLGVNLLWNVSCRRSLVGQLRFEPFPQGEDCLFAMKCLTRAKTFVVTSAVLYGYVQRPDSCTHVPCVTRVTSAIRVTLRINQCLSAWKMARYVDREIRKEFCGGYCGHVFEQIRKLPADDRAQILPEYWKTGREICRIWNWRCPLLGRNFLFAAFVYGPWRIKVALFRNPLTRRLISLLRAERGAGRT